MPDGGRCCNSTLPASVNISTLVSLLGNGFRDFVSGSCRTRFSLKATQLSASGQTLQRGFDRGDGASPVTGHALDGGADVTLGDREPLHLHADRVVVVIALAGGERDGQQDDERERDPQGPDAPEAERDR